MTAPFTITATQPTSFLSTQTLEAEMLLGNVTVSTTSSAAAPLGGTISVNSPVTWANTNRLTLAADQSVNINAPITATLGSTGDDGGKRQHHADLEQFGLRRPSASPRSRRARRKARCP